MQPHRREHRGKSEGFFRSVKTRKIIDYLPQIYKKFLPDLFEELIPEEVSATCDHCVRYGENQPIRLPDFFYYARTKCCAYHPALPNYLIGALLVDGSPLLEEGRQRIRARIREGIEVLPQGIFPPPEYVLLYRKSKQAGNFGKSESLCCPYYEYSKGKCTIWKFRESVCSSFYCKHDNGYDGKVFWNTLRDYLLEVEDQLSRYVLSRKNWKSAEVMMRSFRKVTSSHFPPLRDTEDPLNRLLPPDARYKALWGDWFGREEAFYTEAFFLIDNLSRSEFENILGPSHHPLLEKIRKNREQMMHPRLPDLLKKNPDLAAYQLSDGSYFVFVRIGEVKNHYRISSPLYDILEMFDGHRSTEEICKALLESKGIELTKKLIIELYQNRVLTEWTSSPTDFSLRADKPYT